MGDLLGSPRVASLLFAPRDDDEARSVRDIIFFAATRACLVVMSPWSDGKMRLRGKTGRYMWGKEAEGQG